MITAYYVDYVLCSGTEMEVWGAGGCVSWHGTRELGAAGPIGNDPRRQSRVRVRHGYAPHT
jgi:hypothetical protein